MSRSLAISAVLAGAILAVAPARAEDRPVIWDRSVRGLVLPPAADSGKPQIPSPSPNGTAEPDSCAAPLPCGARLLGTVRKNGAVELQVPALRW